MLRIIFVILGVVILLLVGAIVALPFLIPADVLEEQIETAASEALGRQVTIEGAPDISVFPTRARVQGLVVANADGFSAPHLLAVESADIGVKLLPLLSSRVEVTQFNLEAPDIRLEAKPDGSVNWLLGAPSTEDDAPGTDEPTALPDIRLGTVNVNNGTVTYDTGTGTVYEATDTDIVLTMNSLDEPLTIDGTMTLQGEPATLGMRMSTPRRFAESNEADLALNMSVGQNSAETTLSLRQGLTFTGELDVDVPALRSLMALVGAELDTPNGFRRVRLKGPVSGDLTQLSFGEDTEVTFDDISGTGQVTISIANPTPMITGNVALGALDTRPYLPAEPEQMTALREGEAAAFPPWSTDPMDFSALGAVDADLTVSATQILLPSLEIGPSTLSLRIDNRDLTATVSQMALYEGQGTGTLGMNLRGRSPRLDANFELTSVNIGAFAEDFLGVDRLQGTGRVNIDLDTAGASQEAFVRNLTGTAGISLDNGTLQGVNLGKIARGAQQAFTSLQEGGFNAATIGNTLNTLTLQSQGPAEETDFSDLTVAATIRNGIVTTNQLNMVGPYFEIIGAGNVDLPAQSMRINLTPSVDEIEGEGRSTLPVPVLVSGTFNAPRVGIDAAPVIQGLATGQLRDLLGDQGVELQEGATLEDSLRETARSELGRLLSGNREEETEGEPEGAPNDEDANATPEPSLEEALINEGLNRLFGDPPNDDQ